MIGEETGGGGGKPASEKRNRSQLHLTEYHDRHVARPSDGEEMQDRVEDCKHFQVPISSVLGVGGISGSSVET